MQSPFGDNPVDFSKAIGPGAPTKKLKKPPSARRNKRNQEPTPPAVTAIDSMKGGIAAATGATIDISAIALEAGDLIVWAAGTPKLSDFGPDYYPIPTGFTEIIRREAADTYSTLSIAGYKVSDGTETSLSVASGGTGDYNAGYMIFVFRDADLVDIPASYAQALNTFDPPSVSVTPSVSGASVLFFGFVGNGTQIRVADGASELTGFIAHDIDDTPAGTAFFGWMGGGIIASATGATSANLTQNGVDGSGDPLADDIQFSAASIGIAIRPYAVLPGDQLVLSGDMQSGTDQLLLSGDMQSGTDVLLPSTTSGA